MKIQPKQISILLGDIIVLYLSLYLTLLIRYGRLPTGPLWHDHFYPFTIVFVGWLLIFYISNLYDLHQAVNNAQFFQRTAQALTISGLLSAAFFYLNPLINIAPKRNLIIYIIVFVVLFYLWRNLYNWLLKSYLPKNTIAIIGYNLLAKELINELRGKPHLGYNIAFVVDDKNSANPSPFNSEQNQLPLKIDEDAGRKAVPVLTGFSEFTEQVKEKKVTTIVLTSDPHQSTELRNSLFALLPYKISYVNLPNFYENLVGKIPIEAISQMWFLENLSEGSKKLYDIFKRTYDIIISLLILLISLPFWPLIGLLLKIENQESIFFIQVRAGKNAKPFKLIKFRTQKTISQVPEPTKENDTRTTKVGQFLRKTRLDELPQMINILNGEMSFVGPRPERPELIKELVQKIPFYRERMLVKPGLTGWDQISGEYHSPSYEDTLKKLQYDLFYIKNRSIYLDLSIILKTIATVLSRGGM